jgi:hypothetical protein
MDTGLAFRTGVGAMDDRQAEVSLAPTSDAVLMRRSLVVPGA